MSAPTSKSATILVVDDDRMMRLLLSTYLRQDGHHVVCADNGADALRKLDGPIDMLFTDIFMPEKDGLELIPVLRQRLGATPIVAVSGGSERVPGDMLRIAAALGADAVISKPFTAAEILGVTRKLLADRQP